MNVYNSYNGGFPITNMRSTNSINIYSTLEDGNYSAVTLKSGTNNFMTLDPDGGMNVVTGLGGIAMNSSGNFGVNTPLSIFNGTLAVSGTSQLDGTLGVSQALFSLTGSGGLGLGNITNFTTNNSINMQCLTPLNNTVSTKNGTCSVILDPTNSGVELSAGLNDYIAIPTTANGGGFIGSFSGNIQLGSADRFQAIATNSLGLGAYDSAASPAVYLCGQYNTGYGLKVSVTGSGGPGLGDVSVISSLNGIALISTKTTATSTLTMKAGNSGIAIGATTGIAVTSAAGNVSISPAPNSFVTAGLQGASSATSGWLCVGPGSAQLTPASPILGTIIVGTDGLVYIWAGLPTSSWQRITTTSNDPPAPV